MLLPSNFTSCVFWARMVSVRSWHQGHTTAALRKICEANLEKPASTPSFLQIYFTSASLWCQLKIQRQLRCPEYLGAPTFISAQVGGRKANLWGQYFPWQLREQGALVPLGHKEGSGWLLGWQRKGSGQISQKGDYEVQSGHIIPCLFHVDHWCFLWWQ